MPQAAGTSRGSETATESRLTATEVAHVQSGAPLECAIDCDVDVSETGVCGWMTAMRSPNAKGIVAYEPSYMFPKEEMPAPIPLFDGQSRVGTPVTLEDFIKLTKMPIHRDGSLADLPAPHRFLQYRVLLRKN